MTESASQGVELLRSCEERGLAPDYGKPEVSIDSLGAEVFVVSDLHLSAGRRYDGTYSGCENFFCDQSFERFLKYAHDNLEQNASGALLVINGDFIDFLRVAETPAGKEEFIEWEKLLDRIGAEPKRTSDELEASIAKE